MNSVFEDLSKETVENLNKNGITSPTPVQQKVIPLISQRENILFQSETGTGKTFAYLIPLVERLLKLDNPKKEVKLLIASPTYELASQIKIQFQKLSSLKCILCIGGAPVSRQIEMLKEKPVAVIGGSARLLELIHLKKLKADAVDVLVLDEADRLLSPELRDETIALMERLPKSVQLIGNSATVSEFTRKTLEKMRTEAGIEGSSMILVELPKEDVLQKRIEHQALFSERRDKIDTLRSYINAVKPEKLIVFTSKTDQVENIASKLKFRKIECEGLCRHSDKKERKTVIDRFKSGKLKILITTDLASRGLDIPDITHVIQMDLPENDDFFIHRAGRTARAGKTGINCVIGDEVEMHRYAALEKKLHLKVYPKILYGGKLLKPEDAE
ncbi:ATP-dependent helicase [Treponema rectale]|uniref:ATP-dependent helicase n=1 Tax=Treponema rectale TaxID=744512 RepID=A0A840SCK7_9SPIR|nr:DEAD/DEAH box helicase [Treponema rectale]MBB5218515.1 superfamily II DNA/RNA helicase [Treponema rectale]QOS39800.1 ATP-dependent helicase [Treponema rectale]